MILVGTKLHFWGARTWVDHPPAFHRLSGGDLRWWAATSHGGSTTHVADVEAGRWSLGTFNSKFVLWMWWWWWYLNGAFHVCSTRRGKYSMVQWSLKALFVWGGDLGGPWGVTLPCWILSHACWPRLLKVGSKFSLCSFLDPEEFTLSKVE